jgi:ureidoacrylate peracid hydrolase
MNDAILTPSRTALLVIDVQNDFCDPRGATALSGKSVAKCVTMVPRLARFLDEARRMGVRAIFVQMQQTASTDSPAWLYGVGEGRRIDKCAAGTWGADFYVVAPMAGEPVVIKHRYSAFINTDLESILRSWGIETLVMTGVTSNTCVESTARDGYQRDYYVVMVSDCVAAYTQSGHDTALDNIRQRFGHVATADAILAVWSKAAAAMI